MGSEMCIRDSQNRLRKINQKLENLEAPTREAGKIALALAKSYPCLLYTSDAADERSSVDLGGRRIIKKKKSTNTRGARAANNNNEKSL